MIHSSSVVPCSLNEICGDQEFNKNIQQEIIDDHVFNGIILRGNYNNESLLFQIGYEYFYIINM